MPSGASGANNASTLYNMGIALNMSGFCECEARQLSHPDPNPRFLQARTLSSSSARHLQRVWFCHRTPVKSKGGRDWEWQTAKGKRHIAETAAELFLFCSKTRKIARLSGASGPRFCTKGLYEQEGLFPKLYLNLTVVLAIRPI